nr:hypothetical protein [uncultured Shinella sp.]
MRELFRYLEFRDIVAFAAIIAFLIVALGYADAITDAITVARITR